MSNSVIIRKTTEAKYEKKKDQRVAKNQKKNDDHPCMTSSCCLA